MKIIRNVQRHLYGILGPRQFESLRFLVFQKRALGRLDTLSDRIALNKFRIDLESAAKWSDKGEAKVLARNSVETLHVPETYFVGQFIEEDSFNGFPDKFIVKSTHGSGHSLVVRDKSKLSYKEMRYAVESMLTSNVANYKNEFWYERVTPRVIVEELLLEDDESVPLDYKFYCANGRVAFVQVDIGRFVEHRRSIFDLSWNRLPCGIKYPRGGDVEKPEGLDDMIKIASQISMEFDLCRVDLYWHKSRAWFGELTFAPGSGMERIYPKEWDAKLAQMLDCGKSFTGS